MNKPTEQQTIGKRHEIECAANMTGAENDCDCGLTRLKSSKPEQLPGRPYDIACECEHCPEQPNTELLIVKTIQGLMATVVNGLEKLPDNPLKRIALDDIGIFESGVLYKLQKEFE
ncbi:hypothetical protein LCGC14_1108230 [marine sediment metagenome]|uniref:Uncharacterized protein n=1 Tax=marine sediment metagenome TaxID=412755 RepID=A0A0F9M7K1_9ZZZZ